MSIQAKRGTRAQIDAAAGSNGLKLGEMIYITDEETFATATSTSTYVEVGGGSDLPTTFAFNLHFGA